MRIRLARNQAERLVSSLGVPGPPIDVIRVALALGVQVKDADLGDDVSGLLLTKGEAKVIFVNSDHSERRKRFTIGHELGHLYLAHQFEAGDHVHVDRGISISQRGARASTGEDPKEVEANQFAACLLMPSQLVREEAERRHRLDEDDVVAMADEFNVSVQAMTIRLTALGLL